MIEVNPLRAVLDHLGAPQHVISLEFRMEASAPMQATCTYYPVDAEGHYFMHEYSKTLEILTEHYVLVRRDAFYDLPSSVQATLTGQYKQP